MLDLEAIEQLLEILDEGLAARAIRAIRRLPKTSMIEGHAAILARENRHLLPPTQMVATGPMCKDDGRPVSVYLVVQVDPIDLCFWHVRNPQSIVTYWYAEPSRFPILAPAGYDDNPHGVRKGAQAQPARPRMPETMPRTFAPQKPS